MPRRFLKVLKPGGRLLISDYCRAPGAPTPAFAKYIEQRGYDLHSVEDYGAMLAHAGFQAVKAKDCTWQVGDQEPFLHECIAVTSQPKLPLNACFSSAPVRNSMVEMCLACMTVGDERPGHGSREEI